MDTLQALQQLGLTMPGPAYIAGALLFGLVGLVAYRAGRRAERPMTTWLGVALMLYPYGVSSTPWLYGVGLTLCTGLYLNRR